jgi:hypothetical protein
MGHIMGTRAQVLLVSVSLSSFVTTGCIFGGKKKVPQAKAVSTSAPELDAQLDPRTPDRLPRGARALKSERSAEGLVELPKHAGTATPSMPPAAPAAPAAPLAPKDSGVEWPKPEEFAIGTPGVPRSAQAPRQQAPTVAPDAAAAAAPIPDDRVVIRDAGTAADGPQAAAPAAQAAAAKPSDDAVANRPLELQSDGSAAAAPTTAATPLNGEARPAAHVASAASPAAAADALVSRVDQRLRDNPGDLAAQLDHQLMRFLLDEQVPDLNSLSSLPAEDRELITALMDGLSNFRSNVRTDQNMLLSKKVRPLLDLAARLSSQSDLTIPTIALCRRVSGFGTYDPMDARFVAGNKVEAIVYCEVGNVASQQNQEGVWESRLTQEAVLYTEGGQRVWSNPPRAIVDKSRNRRHDFCVAQMLTLPGNLSINRYILKVTVKDEQAKRMAEAAMPIQIVAVLEPQPVVPPAPSSPITTVPPARQPAPTDLAQPAAAQRGPAGAFDRQLQFPTQTADTK